MRDANLDTSTLFFKRLMSCRGGCDIETPSAELPLDCVRKMKNCIIPAEFLVGQRNGTRVVTEFYEPTTTNILQQIEAIHFFIDSDYAIKKYIITGDSVLATNKRYQWLMGTTGTPVLLRDDLTRLARLSSNTYLDLSYFADGNAQPWVVRHTKWENDEYWREAGLDKPTVPNTITLASNVEATGSITVFADLGGTPNEVRVTAVGHSLEVSGTVVITGTTNYDGVYTVTNISDVDNFDIEHHWDGDDGTGTWTEPATRGSLASGFYKFVISLGILDGIDVESSYGDNILVSPEIDVGTKTFVGTGLDDATFDDVSNIRKEMTVYDAAIDANSDTGSITVFADLGGTPNEVRVTAVGHSVDAGDTVIISGTTNYNGTYTVTNKLDADNFDIEHSWDGNDATGTWLEPDTFKWRQDGGAWTEGVHITGEEQSLDNGITVLFAATSGHTIGDVSTYRVSGRSIKIGDDDLPIPDAPTSVNKLYIYRTTSLASAGATGIFYLIKTISEGDTEWTTPDRDWTDDGTATLDLSVTAKLNNTKPPDRTRFVLNFLDQQLYIAPSGQNSTVWYSKAGEPEHVPYFMPIDNNAGGGITGAFKDISGNCIITKETKSYLVRRWIDGVEALDYSPVSDSVGAMSINGIVNTPYGVVVLGRGNLYVWNGARYAPLVNKYGVSAKKFLEGLSDEALRKAKLGYDREKAQVILTYENPNEPGDYNNAQLVYESEGQRWIWYWTLRANAFSALSNEAGDNATWIGASDRGTIEELDYGNFDRIYNVAASPLWGPYDSPPAGTHVGVWGPSGGILTIVSAPTAGGSGYTLNDVLTVAGGTDGTVTATGVSAGVVTEVTKTTNGYGYTTGSGKATTGGTGTGCTIEILTVSTTASQWSSGEQVISELWMRPEDFTFPNDPRWPPGIIIDKLLAHIFADITPLTENQLQISICSGEGNDAVELWGWQPIFTQLGGFDVEAWDFLTFDTNLYEEIWQEMPEKVIAKLFQVRIKFPIGRLKTRGSITAIADLGGTPNLVRITSENHIFVVGDFVLITGTDSYDGTYKIVAKPDGDNLDIEHTWEGSETGEWLRFKTRRVPSRWKMKNFVYAWRNLHLMTPTNREV